MIERTDVAIVGGGPAGAALAIHLAGRGIDVVVLERAPAYRWRACGVFSPSALTQLADLGLDPENPALANPIRGLRLEVAGAPALSLFTSDSAAGVSTPAAGFDRRTLDRELLARAERVGAKVRRGAEVVDVSLAEASGAELRVRELGRATTLAAGLVVGADGIRSIVARAAAVSRRPRLGRRIGLTFHLPAEVTAAVAREQRAGPAAPQAAQPFARMIVFDGGYCGLAPVPGSRVNVGIVLHGERRRQELKRDGALRLASRILAEVDGSPSAGRDRADVTPLDYVAGSAPLGHRVSRAAGRNWLLVGDASGFVDPFTGEGLGRAFLSAELASEAIERRDHGRGDALEVYAAELRRQFASRDRLSLLIQAFVSRPVLLSYALRRLADREGLARTIDLVLADRLPPEHALAPRFLAALLAP